MRVHRAPLELGVRVPKKEVSQHVLEARRDRKDACVVNLHSQPHVNSRPLSQRFKACQSFSAYKR